MNGSPPSGSLVSISEPCLILDRLPLDRLGEQEVAVVGGREERLAVHLIAGVDAGDVVERRREVDVGDHPGVELRLLAEALGPAHVERDVGRLLVGEDLAEHAVGSEEEAVVGDEHGQGVAILTLRLERPEDLGDPVVGGEERLLVAVVTLCYVAQRLVVTLRRQVRRLVGEIRLVEGDRRPERRHVGVGVPLGRDQRRVRGAHRERHHPGLRVVGLARLDELAAAAGGDQIGPAALGPVVLGALVVVLELVEARLALLALSQLFRYLPNRPVW